MKVFVDRKGGALRQQELYRGKTETSYCGSFRGNTSIRTTCTNCLAHTREAAGRQNAGAANVLAAPASTNGLRHDPAVVPGRP